MIKIALAVAIIIGTISCEALKKNDNTEEPFVSLGEKIEKSSSFSTDEQLLIQNICESFRYKRENFSYKFWNSTFKYEVTSHECQATKSSTQQHSVQFGLGLNFVSESDFPFETVQSDQSGFLSHICERYFEMGLPMDMTNTVSHGYNQVAQTRFKKTDEDYKLFVLIATRGKDNSYFVTLVDELTIQIDSSDLNGLVTQHNKIGICPGGTQISTIFSKYLSNSI